MEILKIVDCLSDGHGSFSSILVTSEIKFF